jgi:hypothetical protein
LEALPGEPARPPRRSESPPRQLLAEPGEAPDRPSSEPDRAGNGHAVVSWAGAQARRQRHPGQDALLALKRIPPRTDRQDRGSRRTDSSANRHRPWIGRRSRREVQGTGPVGKAACEPPSQMAFTRNGARPVPRRLFSSVQTAQSRGCKKISGTHKKSPFLAPQGTERGGRSAGPNPSLVGNWLVDSQGRRGRRENFRALSGFPRAGRQALREVLPVQVNLAMSRSGPGDWGRQGAAGSFTGAPRLARLSFVGFLASRARLRFTGRKFKESWTWNVHPLESNTSALVRRLI